MKPQYVKLVLAAVWMLLAVAVFAALGYLRSPSGLLMLAAVALAPPAAIWLWWHDPAETLSESIHAVRENDTRKAAGPKPS